MLRLIKNYPLSILFILTVVYLSLFRPPKTELDNIPNFDKLVHIGMYFGMSALLWVEFLRAHRRDQHPPMWHAWIGALLCPVLFSGAIELVQQYATSYRSGDLMDFLANSTGALLATLLAYFVVRPRVFEKA
ncbi:MAG: VanZ family protein [Mediterranea sp.]|jgi:VanZ family protein|nr:VanZ family protein [Mediterranea sp.]